MNPHRHFHLQNAKPAALLIVFAVSIAAFGLLYSSHGQKRAANKETERPPSFYADLKGPNGKWSAGALPDIEQARNDAAPVYVTRVNSFHGKGQSVGLKVTGVVLKNRSPKTVSAVKLRWRLASQERPDGSLQKDVFELHLEAPLLSDKVEKMELKDSDHINFAKIVKPLLKDESIDGNFTIIIGVSEVLFLDGTKWIEGESVSFLKLTHRPPLAQTGCNDNACRVFHEYPYNDCSAPGTNPGFFCDQQPCNEHGCNCGNEICGSNTGPTPTPSPTPLCTQEQCEAINPCSSCGGSHLLGCSQPICPNGPTVDLRPPPQGYGPTGCPANAYPAGENCASIGGRGCCRCIQDGSQCQQGTVWNLNTCNCDPAPTPTPTPTPPQTPEGCQEVGWYWNYTGAYCQDTQWFCETEPDCPFNWTWSYLTCQCTTTYSPILVDVEGDGFNLTSGARGVAFDLDTNGARERLSWTARGSDDAWLALDRDGDGRITSGRELFGNFTPQPDPPAGEERQGFLALAVYDRAAAGGNGDGKINKQDSIFPSLRLWQDANHDGVSQSSELKTLKGLGLKSVDLDYKKSKRTDGHGNEFRYRAKVRDARDAQLGRWAWDVFLVAAR